MPQVSKWLKSRFAVDFEKLSKPKQLAFKALENFNELATDEIQSSIIAKFWEFLHAYSARKILKKPDEEIQKKLYKIYTLLGQDFKKIDYSVELQASEQINDFKLPDVGNIKEIKNLVKTDIKDPDKALRIIKELGL